MIGNAALFRGWANPSYDVAESRSVIQGVARQTASRRSLPLFGMSDSGVKLTAADSAGVRVTFGVDDTQAVP